MLTPFVCLVRIVGLRVLTDPVRSVSLSPVCSLMVRMDDAASAAGTGVRVACLLFLIALGLVPGASATTCSPNPCANSGSCAVTLSMPYFNCTCAWPFYGATCALATSVCNSTLAQYNVTCLNGGQCAVNATSGTEYCNCTAGWSGPRCESAVVPVQCLDEPCENGGTCVADGLWNYSCECTADYSGQNCTIAVNGGGAGFWSNLAIGLVAGLGGGAVATGTVVLCYWGVCTAAAAAPKGAVQMANYGQRSLFGQVLPSPAAAAAVP